MNKIQFVAGRRCLFLPSRNPRKIMNNSPPLLVLIGGTAQSITSWEHHLSTMHKDRDVLVYECLGQGPLSPSGVENFGDNFSDVSLQTQSNHFFSVLSNLYPTSPPMIDIAGFSFGGRIAMAIAASSSHSNLIRKLHITGVPARRNNYGRLIISSWKDMLQNIAYHDNTTDTESLKPFAWSSLLSTHSSKFLSKFDERRVKLWVDHVCQQNTIKGLHAIIEQTHTEDEDNEWHVMSMAKRILEQKGVASGRLAVGGVDPLADVTEVERLSDILGWGDVDVYEGCGHAVVIEEARRWRNDLLEFLDAE